MKTIIFRFLITVCFAVAFGIPGKVRAAESRSTLSYLIGFPSSDTKDFAEDPSFIGAEVDFGVMPIGAGGEWSFLLGWQRFDDNRGNQTFTDESRGLTITSDQERSLTHMPVLMKWRYYPQTEGSTMWFAGAGAGTTYIQRRFFAGSFDLSNYGWQVLLRAEGGGSFEINPSLALETKLQYDYGFKTGTLPILSIVSIGIGITTYY